MKCEYWTGILWIVAYIITVTCSTLMPEVLIILALILWFVYYMLKHISIISMWIKGWLNGKGMFTIMILVIVIFFALWYNGLICTCYCGIQLSKESAELSYYKVNTISGILTPVFSLIAVIVAYRTLCSQREQNAIQNFESHLFQMIDQQHKLEEKVVNKHGSFRELYKDFCVIYVYVRHYALHHFGDVNGDKWKEILLKITYYIFYFGADEDFMCDNTYQTLIKQDVLKKEKEKLKSLIKELNNIQILKCMAKDKYDNLFKTQKSEELGIYYRNLFNAIGYIDRECPDEDKKEYYAKLVRTNLSDFAQLMLYYNMQGERGNAWLKKDEVKSPKNDNDCLLTIYKPIKNCAISVKQLDDNQIPEIHQKNELYQSDIIYKIPDETEKAMMDKKLDIDPRNDGRKELFSDDVIDYELKIGKQDN